MHPRLWIYGTDTGCIGTDLRVAERTVEVMEAKFGIMEPTFRVMLPTLRDMETKLGVMELSLGYLNDDSQSTPMLYFISRFLLKNLVNFAILGINLERV